MIGEIDRNAPLTPWERLCVGALIMFALTLLYACVGCVYPGGKVVDGTNLAIGMKIPGTDWQLNVLDYIGGIRVAGNDMTSITVSNEVDETNSYFGVVTTRRRAKMEARIEPCEGAAEDLSDEAEARKR